MNQAVNRIRLKNLMRRHRRRTCGLVLLACAIASAISCSPSPQDAAEGERLRVQGQAGTFPLTITDQLGRQVELDREAQRIVSLAPAHTETLYAIGAGDKVVGVTSFCNYPAAATSCEKVGGFAAHEISVERIVALRPDVVFASGRYHGQLIERLTRLKIQTIALEPTTFDEIYKSTTLMGSVTGHRQQADELVRSMKARVGRVQKATHDGSPPLSVFYVVQLQPLMSVGKNSFICELIELAGGKNVFDDVEMDYPTVNPEAVIRRDPQLILVPTHGGEEKDLVHMAERPGWKSLRAVKDRRLHLIDGDLVARTGPRIVDGLEQMAEKLYPERFSVDRSGSKSQEATE